MAKANSKDAWDATSWKELQELTTVEKITKSLRAEEKQRLAHKRYYLKKDLVLQKAKERGILNGTVIDVTPKKEETVEGLCNPIVVRKEEDRMM